jgi:hypothetical protein
MVPVWVSIQLSPFFWLKQTLSVLAMRQDVSVWGRG